jgi:hypothetical protein
MLVEPVGRHRMGTVAASRSFETASPLGTYAGPLHEAGHAFATATDALSAELRMNLGATVDPATLGMDAFNAPLQAQIRFASMTGAAASPGIVAA